MKPKPTQIAGLILLTATLAAAQTTPAPRPPAPQTGNRGEIIVKINEQDAEQTREQLERLFQQYPPTLKEVLRMDTSLLSNEDYLQLYPALADFLRAHPEVAHNPVYFVGQSNIYRNGYGSDDSFNRIMNEIGPFLAAFIVIGVFTWLVRTGMDYRRWQRLAKVQTDTHTKLMDRFTQNEDLLAYIQTPAGKQFLEGGPMQIETPMSMTGTPHSRILWSTQTGVVLAFAGVGLYLALTRLGLEKAVLPFYVLSILSVALGLGFISSAAASYVISLRLGLFDKPAFRQTKDDRSASSQP